MKHRTNSSSMGQRSSDNRRALIKWTEGPDMGKLTYDLALDWILQFDAAAPVFPETYPIEWRVPPKPRNGWPVWDGVVLEISCKSPLDLVYFRVAFVLSVLVPRFDGVWL